LFPLFVTGVNNTRGTWWQNLPPVSLIPAAGVVDTGGNLPPVLLTPVANLPPVSLTPVVHLDLRIYFREFSKKFKMTLMLFSGAWGKMIHEKYLKQKIS
jgi:hypothetical protein